MTIAMQFDHLGVVVKSLDKSRRNLSAALGIAKWTAPVDDPVNGVRLQFGRDPAGVCYELLQPLDETSPVFEALKSKKGILNHAAYRIEDLDAAGAHFAKLGWARTSEPKPAIAYGNRRIQFFVSPERLIVELIEAFDHEHLYLVEG